MKSEPMHVRTARRLGLLAILAVGVGAMQASAQDLPKKSPEGLDLIPSKAVQAVYWQQGATLAPYKRIHLVDCFVAFRKDWQEDQNRNRRQLSSKISSSDMERIKGLLADLFKEVFTKELEEKGGYQVVDEVGDDVLIIRPALINLDVAAPDVRRGGGQQMTFVASAGSMTLYMELFDSATSALIARVIDSRAAPQRNANVSISSGVNNRAEATQLLSRWAKLLREALDEEFSGQPPVE